MSIDRGGKVRGKTASEKLPEFRNPPVVETVVGVQFEPLPKFYNAHLGAFWRELKGDWSDVADVSPLEPQFERFGEGKGWRAAGLRLKLSHDPSTRLQIRNRVDDRMIQVQNGRLHYNWLGRISNENYPRYEKVKHGFDEALNVFQQCLIEWSLGEFQPNQWEVTYVNQIPKGTVWNEPCDWRQVFASLVSLPAKATSVCLESFSGEWHYEIEPRRGRLHVNLSHGLQKKQDGADVEMLVMNLTARGPVGGDGNAACSLGEGLDLGHETIVRAFRDLTSEDAHKYWELVDD